MVPKRFFSSSTGSSTDFGAQSAIPNRFDSFDLTLLGFGEIIAASMGSTASTGSIFILGLSFGDQSCIPNRFDSFDLALFGFGEIIAASMGSIFSLLLSSIFIGSASAF